MPKENPVGSTPSFEVVTSSKSKKSGRRGIVIAVVIVIFLILSVVAGVILVRQQQNIAEKAQVSLCPAAEACPVSGQPDMLLSCNPAQTDGTPTQLSCSNISEVGQTVFCGATKYCCPSLGAAWSTNLTLCATPSPTPTISPSPTASASASPNATPSASASATPKAQTSPLPIPVTGTDWPTIIGGVVGVGVIVGSILLAL